MKLTPNYSLAVYSSKKCVLVESTESTQLSFQLPFDDPPPNPEELCLIQQSLAAEMLLRTRYCVVLVPDTWVSRSTHRIEHHVPPALQPLAALSYAAETTFSAPDVLLYSYQYQIINQSTSTFTVFSCTTEWAEQLLAPFKKCGVVCFLMPHGLYSQINPGILSWWRYSQRALSVYQPEKAKRNRSRLLWGVLLGLSILLNSMSFYYFTHLENRLKVVVISYQEKRALHQSGLSTQEPDDFVLSTLQLVQTLPHSVRLSHFVTQTDQAEWQITATKLDLDLLLTNWQERFPAWRWDVMKQPHSTSYVSHQKEVVDAFIKVYP